MSYLYICNNSSDYISKVDINLFREVKKLHFNNDFQYRIGPHGIIYYNGMILCANNFSSSLSIFDYQSSRMIEDHFIGMHCNDVCAFNDNAYVACGEINCVVAFDLKEKRISMEMPTQNFPHSIDINNKTNMVVTSNMSSDSITLIDLNMNGTAKNIKVGAYPTKAVFSNDGGYIYVCESNLGSDFRGSMSIVSLKNFEVEKRVKLGNSPIDMTFKNNICFVSNLGDGTVSIVDMNYLDEWKKIFIGGMPRGIINVERNIYVCDTQNDKLFCVDIFSENKKEMAIGKEPCGMIFA